MPIQPSEPRTNRPGSPLTSFGIAEYRELRATIRERGSLRHVAILITFSVWTATMMWAASTFSVSIFFLLPLLVLVAGFEVAFALHVGVERIGRFIQVRYEREIETEVSWERTAMALRVAGGGIDPLFLKLFVLTAVLNLLAGIWTTEITPASSAAVFERAELAVFVGAHAAAVVRWISAARYARSQRSRDLAAFEELLR
jgi:hypothetical protein